MRGGFGLYIEEELGEVWEAEVHRRRLCQPVVVGVVGFVIGEVMKTGRALLLGLRRWRQRIVAVNPTSGGDLELLWKGGGGGR